jgi:hypothetical protein
VWLKAICLGVVFATPCGSYAASLEHYNTLVDEHNALIASQQSLQAEYNALVVKYNALTKREKQHLNHIRALQTEQKKMVRTLKLPGCSAARETLKQCLPEIFIK